jgi:ADP-L-glycero-D-manno-heptose 6-epimerase
MAEKSHTPASPPNKAVLLTGAAGFIGSRVARSLAGRDDVSLISVDARGHFRSREEHRGIAFGEIVGRDELMGWLGNARPGLAAILHIGACSDTLEMDAAYLRKMNVEYSQRLWTYAAEHGVPFVYASSAATYGAGENGYDDAEENIPLLRPLNPYGESKQAFDRWVLEQDRAGRRPPAWSGFKFFNVYGFGERHKGRMASVALHAYDQVKSRGYVELFRSHKEGIADGEQKRDFVYVDDVVAVLQYAWETSLPRGIYNLGSGRARTFLELAWALFDATAQGEVVRFVDTPVAVRGRYQYFTEAPMAKLRAAGYERPFVPLEEGIRRYVRELEGAERGR